MYRAETIDQVKKYVHEWKKQGLTIGLVPTMGYLHEGHASLIKKARLQNDRVIVSDFVNPMQFGANEDLDQYPRDIEADCKLIESLGGDLVFHPTPQEMYGDSHFTKVHVGTLTDYLCGHSRPVHFDGVCTVVTKLFHITEADRAYFGMKDAQQLAVVRRMVHDLNYNIEIVGCPTVREADGLAKSSRNAYLSPEERAAAPIIHKGLEAGQALIQAGERNAQKVIDAISAVYATEPLAKIDYVNVVDWNDLQPVETIKGETLVAVAVFIGTTREIDNFLINAD
jgi:pantoate--beta-alanine ligase